MSEMRNRRISCKRTSKKGLKLQTHNARSFLVTLLIDPEHEPDDVNDGPAIHVQLNLAWQTK